MAQNTKRKEFPSYEEMLEMSSSEGGFMNTLGVIKEVSSGKKSSDAQDNPNKSLTQSS